LCHLELGLVTISAKTKNVSPLSSLREIRIGRIKVGTPPTPRVTKGCYLRMRVDGRVFNLGKVGSKAADDRRKAVLAAWGAHGGTLPAEFTLDTKKPQKALPKITKEVTAVLSVGDLLRSH